jgi:hypothetical protein
MTDCQHENFDATVEVARLTNKEGIVHAYSADIKVVCHDCKLPFEFPGFAHGISSHEARVSIDGQTMCVPLKPKGQEAFSFYPGFNVMQKH